MLAFLRDDLSIRMVICEAKSLHFVDLVLVFKQIKVL